MATYTFPADRFAVHGDPEAVRESGRAYGRFATTAAEAAAGLRGLDTGFWVGSEGDLFRGQAAEIPPHLDTADGAFAQVAGALGGFAEVLAAAQRQMAGVRADAEQAFQSLADARVRRNQLQEPTAEQVQADPQAQTAYDELKWDLDHRIGRLEDDVGGHLAAAAGIHTRVQEAARHAGNQIRAAGRTSPTADQNWFQDRLEKTKRRLSGWVDDLKGFVAEHAEAFRSLAKALRVVGIALVVVGAVLAVLGVGGAVMVAGFVLWGASDALDGTVDWAEGKITGRQLLFRAGVAIGFSVVGGAAGKVVGKGLERLAPKLQGWMATAEAVRNVQRLADSREALARAQQATARLPSTRAVSEKAAAADGKPTLSGWKQPRPDGFTHATPEAVREYAQRIGHTLRREGANDQAWRPDGWPGRYQASHAEKQQALTAPNHPIAVTKPMCPDCIEFFRRHAIHTGQPQVVTDPDGTRLFHPDGRIIPNPGPKDFGPAPPTPPGPPDGVGREGVKVGAAAGADVGWNLPGHEDR
jgi:hypothetical protein